VAGTESAGHQGRRLSAAFEAIEHFPALMESRIRLLAALDADHDDLTATVAAVETDLGFGVGVLRSANRRGTPGAGRTVSFAEAITALGRPALHVLADRTSAVDVFDRTAEWARQAEAHRRHVTAVQAAIHRVAAALDPEELRHDVDLLCSAALLHDVGKLVLGHAHPGYDALVGRPGTPEQLVAAERAELGVDHTVVGGVLLRRWGLPRELARLVERHHSEDADRRLATLRLADLLAHYGAGDDVSHQVLTRVAREARVDGRTLRALLWDQGSPSAGRRRTPSPCPLSRREMDVLKRLATGQAYKRIAVDLGISASTVRTHLHNVYRKLGAADRAQAVLTAVDRGWLEV
jgi:putative nucleotidyltransferase with HDIG domain